jgi:hypothetical protein
MIRELELIFQRFLSTFAIVKQPPAASVRVVATAVAAVGELLTAAEVVLCTINKQQSISLLFSSMFCIENCLCWRGKNHHALLITSLRRI